MELPKLLLWFALMIPLAYSPGPNNLLCATLGTKYGIRSALPFIIGLNTTVLFATFCVGFFYSRLSGANEVIMDVLKYAGAAMLAYIALKLIGTSKSESESKKHYLPGYFEGVLLNALNPKAIMALAIMYTQFYDPQANRISQIVLFTALTFVLSVGAHLLWTLSGNILRMRLSNDKIKKIQKGLVVAVLILVPVILFLL